MQTFPSSARRVPLIMLSASLLGLVAICSLLPGMATATELANLSGIACPTTGLCVSPDSHGDVLTTTEPTGTASAWRSTLVGGATNDNSAVSCPSSGLCVVVHGDDILTSTDPTGGVGAWSSTTIDANGLSGVACSTTSFCVAVDRGGNVLTTTNPTGGASAWTTTYIANVLFLGISCSSTALCVAVDASGDVVTSTNPLGGAGAWTLTHVDGSTGDELEGVSCASTSLCAATDFAGNVLDSTNPTGGASAWSSSKVSEGFSAASLACPTTGLCVALNYQGDVLTSTNPTGGASAWDATTSVDNRGFPSGLSCPTITLCVGVDDEGNAIVSTDPTGGASAWHLTPAIDPWNAPTDYTWQGGGSSTAWSNTGNWLGGTVPVASEDIGTLTFPVLPALQNSENDLSGLSINHMQVDDSHDYVLSGQGFSLGSGGLTIGASEGTQGLFIASTPIALSSSQTWDISEPTTEAPTKVSFGPNVELAGALSGETAGLTINLSAASLTFGQQPIPGRPADTANDELGEVTINGARIAKGANESLVNLNLARFNASDGHALNLNNVSFEDYETATGPIMATDSGLSLGGSSIGPVTASQSRLFPEGILSLPSLSLDIGSSLVSNIFAQGTTPGVDYDELTSVGTVALGGATLDLNSVAVNNGTECPPPPVGQVDTLVSTTGSLTGSFGNAPSGSTIVAWCTGSNGSNGNEITAERWYSYRVNYNTASSPKIVTATALPAVPTIPTFGVPPIIAGTATQGQTLTETHGYWTNSPTSYSEQWERCDSGGNTCQNIAGAVGQSYTLSVADVGSIIRVQETASNSEGASTPEVSAPTAVVQTAPVGGGSSGGGNTTSGGGASGGSSTGSASGGGTTATISSAQIAALLGSQLAPSGKAATIPALLKSGGLTMSFKALEAGTLSVQWYEVPTGAKLAKHSKAKPVLVASGQTTFVGAGTGKLKIGLTAQGKQVLKHTRRVELEAKGNFRSSGGSVVSVVKDFGLER
jgi:hypothetical protein